MKHYTEERKKIGSYRVEKMRIRFEALGYKVTTFPIEATGLDMIAENNEQVIGLEITNWNKNGYLNFDRLSNMIQNYKDLEFKLKQAKDTRAYRRILVYSFTENIENMIPYLFEAKVELMKIGRQDLPDKEEVEGWLSA